MTYFTNAKDDRNSWTFGYDTFGPGFRSGDAFTANIERIRHSEAREGANAIRTNAMDAILDGGFEEMTNRELYAFTDAMQAFAPIVIRR